MSTHISTYGKQIASELPRGLKNAYCWLTTILVFIYRRSVTVQSLTVVAEGDRQSNFPLRDLLSWCIFLALFAGSNRADAQISAPTIPDNGPTAASPLGIPPGASASGTYENVALMNGSLNLYLPVLSIPQRGGYSLELAYIHHSNSRTLYLETQASTTPYQNLLLTALTYTGQIVDPDGMLAINLPRLRASSEYVGTYGYQTSGVYDYADDIYCQTNFVYTDWQGNSHPFENKTDCNDAHAGNFGVMADVSDSWDGSFYRLDTTNITDITVTAKDGTVYHFYGDYVVCPGMTNQGGSCTGTPGYYALSSVAGKIVDTNGNTIMIASTVNAQNQIVYTITDTIKRNNISISPTGVSYMDSNGKSQTISVTTNSSGTTTWTDGLTCRFAGTLPNKPYPQPTVNPAAAFNNNTAATTTVKISFPPGNGGSPKIYILTFNERNVLTRIDYPSGGYTRYEYSAGLGAPPFANVTCSANLENSVTNQYRCSSSSGSCSSEDLTTYAATSSGANVVTGQGPFNTTMKITYPLKNVETHYFSTTSPNRTNPQETDIVYSDSSGAALKTIHKDYPTGPSIPGGAWGYDVVEPSRITTTLNDVTPNIGSYVQYQYDTFSALPSYYGTVYIDNPTSITETDFGGATKRTTAETWAHAGFFSSNSHILNRPIAKTITDNVTGNVQSFGYVYDNGGNTVGNVTQMTETATAAPTAITGYVVNGYGEVTQITDPDLHITSIDYTDNWSNGVCEPPQSSAYPTKITNAAGEITKYLYNSCTGTIASESITNTSNAPAYATGYIYDALQRVISTSLPDGGGQEVCYFDASPSSATTYTLQAIGASLPACSTPTATTAGVNAASVGFDGIGRKASSQVLGDPAGADMTDTTYDPNGNIFSVSSPHRQSDTERITQYHYDGLNRMKATIYPDNTGEGWSYSGNTVTYTDGNSNQWERVSDAFGHLTTVLEPDPVTGTPSMETDYKYDGFGNLTSVVQSGGSSSSGARTRSFTYTGSSQLLTASNPETGTTCYGLWSGSTCKAGYDAVGNLTQRTDARGIIATYKYDAVNRVISKSYADPSGSQSPANTPTSCYQYYSSSVPYSVGRPVLTWTQSYNAGACSATGSFLTKRSISAYDGMGRVKSEQQYTLHNQSSPYQPTYSYDLAGNLLTASNGITSTPTVGTVNIGYSYDDAGHLQAVTSNWKDTAHPSPLFATQSSPAEAYQCPNPTWSSAYAPFGSLLNATLGNGITLSRGFDIRMRRNCEIDAAPNAH